MPEKGKQEQKAQFIELRAKGLSYAAIAKKLKVAKATLANWNAELEAEIASLKAMEIEALYEEYGLLKESREDLH
jgi:transposase